MKLTITFILLSLAAASINAQKTTIFNGIDLSGWNVHGT